MEIFAGRGDRYVDERKRRILVAEDDADINRLICRILEDNGYTAVGAFSGTEAALRLETERFDVMVLDLMMPGMDGRTLLAQMQPEKKKSMMVLVVSACSALEDKVELLRCGADDYMTKPFEPEELLARVYALLRRAEKSEGDSQETKDKLVYKNLCLFPKARTAQVGGEELSLTRHEYEILALLVSSPDKVFSRETLYEQVWQGGYYGEDNTVNVHVSNLRRKLAAKDAQTEYIKTVWGIGFKMA